MRDRAGQYRAPSFDAHFDIVRPREQIERVVDEILDFLIVGRAEWLAAPHGDGRQERRGRDANGTLRPMKAGTPLASGLETTADNPVAKFGPPNTPPNACGSTAGPFSVGPALKGPTDADP